MHVNLPVDENELDMLLKDAWQIPVAVGLPRELLDALDNHTRILLAGGIEFRRGDLLLTLSRLPPELTLSWESHSSSGGS